MSENNPLSETDRALRSRAALRVLGDPAADVSKRLKEQIELAIEGELARAYGGQTSDKQELSAIQLIHRGIEQQIAAKKSKTRKEKVQQAVLIGVASVGITVYAGNQAYDAAAEIPQNVAERVQSVIPSELGTKEISILGQVFTIPDVSATNEKRDAQIAAAQQKLDDSIESTVTFSEVAVGSLVAGAAAEIVFVGMGLSPLRRKRGMQGKRTASKGWRQLGSSPQQLRKWYAAK